MVVVQGVVSYISPIEQGVVTPIRVVLRAATGVTTCDCPKTVRDRMTTLLNCQ